MTNSLFSHKGSELHKVYLGDFLVSLRHCGRLKQAQTATGKFALGAELIAGNR